MNNGLGAISAGGGTPTVTMHGGAKAVDVEVASINCCTGGTGSDFRVQVNSGDLKVGNISTTGITTLKANGATGDVLTCGTISSTGTSTTLESKGGNVVVNNTVSNTGDLTLKGAAAVTLNADVSSTAAALTMTGGTKVVVNATFTASGATTSNVNTPTLNLDGTLKSGSGILTVQGTGADNALSVVMGAIGAITSTNNNVQFNTATKQGSITMNNGNGAVSANAGTGTVTMHGGNKVVNVNVNTIDCCTGGTGSDFTIIVNSGDLKVGGITTSGITTLKANGSSGDVLTCGTISSTGTTTSLESKAGNVVINNKVSNTGDLNITSGPAGSVTISAEASSTGAALKVTSGTGAGSKVTIDAGVTASGATTASVNTPSLIQNGTLQSGSGILTVQGTGTDNALSVTMGAAGVIKSTGSNVQFNSAGLQGSITMLGGKGDIIALGTSPSVTMHGGGKAVDVNVNSINCCTGGTGSTFSVQVASGDLKVGGITTTGTTTLKANGATGDVLTCGTINASGGNLTMQSANGNVQLSHAVSETTGKLNLTSGTAGKVQIDSGITVEGKSSVNVTTPTLLLATNAKLNATAGDLVVVSNAGGASNPLNVVLNSGSQLNANATGAKVTFNVGAPGSININANPGQGLISSATVVTLEGGSKAVNVNVDTIVGCVGGTGDPFNVTTGSTALLSVGNISTPGSLNFDTNGNLTFCGDCTSTAGSISATTPITKSITVNSTVTVKGETGINFTTGTLNNSGSVIAVTGSAVFKANTINNNTGGVLQASAGNVELQANTLGTLTVVTQTGSNINAVGTNSKILFNPTTAAAVDVSGAGNLSAGKQLVLNTNGADASINVGSISGTLTANGNVGVLIASTLNSGLTIDGITTTGAATATAGNGNLIVSNLSGGTTVDLKVTAGGNLTANTVQGVGNVTLKNQSTGTGEGAVTVGGTGLKSTGGAVSLISGAKGDITVNSGAPVSAKTTLDFAAGTNGSVVTNAKVSSDGNLTIASGAAGSVTLNANAASNAAALKITSGIGAGNSVTISSGVTASGFTTADVNTPLLNQDGTLQSGSGLLTVQGTAADNALKVVMGTNGVITSTGNSVQFNTAAKEGSITMNNGNGAISAFGTTPTVTLHGGTKAVDVNVNTINCCTGGTGSDFSVTVNSGDLKVGNISTTGVTTLKANGTTGDVLTCGTISSTGTDTTLQSKGGNVVVDHKVSNTGNMNLLSGPAGSVTINAEVSSTAAALKVTSGTGAASAVTIKAGVTASGATTADVNTPTLNQNGTLKSGTGILTVQGTGTDNALTVVMGSTGAITSTGSNVQFNSATNKGSITMNNGLGAISAGGGTPTVTMHGGAKAVDVEVASINCCTGGTGSDFRVQVNSGDLKVGNISTTGITTLKANGATGDVLTCGTISSTGTSTTLESKGGNVVVNNTVSNTGDLTLKGAAAVTLNADVSSTAAALTMTGGTKVVVNSTFTASGATTSNVNTPTLNLDGTLKSGSGILTVQGTGTGNALTVSMGAAGVISSTSNNVQFNSTANKGSITMVGGLGAISAGGGNPNVTLHGGGDAVDVNVGTINCCTGGTGSTFSVQVASGDLKVGNITTTGTTTLKTNGASGDVLTCGTISASGGDLTMQSANGNVQLAHAVSETTGKLILTSGNTGSVILNAGIVAEGKTAVNVTTPTLNLATNAKLNATGGDLTVVSNAGGASNPLNVILNTGSQLNANFTGAKVTFNVGAPGSINIDTNAGKGLISSATVVTLEGGTNAVNVDVDTIIGCVGGSGDPFNVKTASTATLSVGGITTPGSLNFVTGGDLTFCADCTSTAGSISATTPATNSINVNGGVTLTGKTGINFTTGTLNNSGSVIAQTGSAVIKANTINNNAGGLLQASAGNVELQTNTATKLTVVTQATSNINALGAGSKILFNPTSAAAVDVTGTGNLSAASQLVLNTNGADATVNAGSISGTLTANGKVGNLSTSTVNGGLTIDAITTTGTVLATSSNGTLLVSNLSGGSTVNLNVTTGGNLVANTVQGVGNVVLNNTSTGTGEGAITIGGTGLKSTAAAVSLSSGKNGDITVNTGAPVSAKTTLDLTAGLNGNVITNDKLSSDGNLTIASGANGSVNLKANASSNAAALKITSGTGTGNSVTIAAGVNASGATTTDVYTPVLNQDGTLQSGSGILTVQGTGTGNALTVVMGANGAISSTGNNVQFNTKALEGSVTMNNGKGAISAAGANPTVTLHGGGKAVDVNVNTINCCTGGTGSTFSVAVNSGDLKAGNIKASSDITLAANGTTGDVLTCGTIESTGGKADLQSKNGSVLVSDGVTGKGAVSLTSGAAGSITVNAAVSSTADALTIKSGTAAASNVTIKTGIIASGATTADVYTPTLNQNGILQSGSGTLTVQGTGTDNALVVVMGAGGAISSTGNNVQFNSTGFEGAITMNNGKGAISAGGANPTVTLNGGTKAVTVDVNTINCCTGGTGSTFSVAVNSGDLKAGNITASGDIALAANGSSGDVLTCGVITSNGGKADLESKNGNVVVSDAVSGKGAVSLKSGPAGSITVSADVTSTTAGLTMKSGTGAASNITINVGATASGATTTDVFTPTLNQNGTLQSGSGILTVQGTGTDNALVVVMGAKGAISSTGNNVQFNSTGFEGAITMNNGKGAISAGGGTPTVTLNGGTKAVSVDVDSINCCTGGTGSTFSVAVNSGDLKAGNITASSDISLAANGATGDVLTCGVITSTGGKADLVSKNGNVVVSDKVTGNGAVSLKSGANGSVTVSADVTSLTSGLTIKAGTGVTSNVTIDAGITASGATTTDVFTPTLNQNGILKSGTGILTVQGTGTDNSLTVVMGANGVISSTGNNVQFNSTGLQGAITMNNGKGAISAGGASPTVSLNGGTKAVDVDVNTINCCTGGTGSTFSVAVNSGDLKAGNISASSDITLAANGATGDVLTCGVITSTGGKTDLQSKNGSVLVSDQVTGNGDVTLKSGAAGSVTVNANVASDTAALTITSGNATGSSVTIKTGVTASGATTATVNTPTLNQNGILQSGSGILTVQGTGAGNGLTVVMGTNGLISSTGNNVQFNSAGLEGAVTMNNGKGAISAGGATPNVILNGGTDAVDVNVNSINCCTGGTGSTFSVQVNSGNLSAGNISASNSVNLKANGTSGDVLTCGTITSTSGTTTLESKNGNVVVSKDVSQTGGGLVLTAGNTVVIDAGVNATGSTTTNVNTPNLTNNGTLQSGTGLLTIQGTGAGNSLNVVLGAGSTTSSTGGDVRFNTPGAAGPITITGGAATISAGSGNPTVTLNGGSGNVNVNAGNINGTATGTGSSVGVTVNNGNLQAAFNIGGPLTLTNTSNTGSINSKGDLIGSSVTLTTGAGGSVNLSAGDKLSGGAVNVNTPTFNVGAGSKVTSTSNVTIASTAPGNVLNVNLASNTSSIGATNSVIMNTSAQTGAITINGGTAGTTGSIIAGAGLFLNSGKNDVAVGLNSIDCCVNGSATNFSITTQTGNISKGTITATTLTLNALGGAVVDCTPTPPTPPSPSNSTNLANTSNVNTLANLLNVIIPTNSPFQQLPPTDTEFDPPIRPLTGAVAFVDIISTVNQNNRDADRYIMGARTFKSNFDNTEAQRLTRLNVGIGNYGNGFIEMLSGNCVFAPDRNIVVRTQFGNVSIKAGSIAFIMNTGKEVGVYDLHDNGLNGITVFDKNRHIELRNPGSMVVMTRPETKDFKGVNDNLRWIAYRNTSKHGDMNTVRVFTSDFSLPSALQNVLPLREMRASKEAEDKNAVEKIMKNAVIMFQVKIGTPYRSDRTGITGGGPTGMPSFSGAPMPLRNLPATPQKTQAAAENNEG